MAHDISRSGASHVSASCWMTLQKPFRRCRFLNMGSTTTLSHSIICICIMCIYIHICIWYVLIHLLYVYVCYLIIYIYTIMIYICIYTYYRYVCNIYIYIHTWFGGSYSPENGGSADSVENDSHPWKSLVSSAKMWRKPVVPRYFAFWLINHIRSRYLWVGISRNDVWIFGCDFFQYHQQFWVQLWTRLYP